MNRLEFVILTAARSGEALGAAWAKIDLEARQWRVPTARMKGGEEDVVALSRAAVSLLEPTPPEAPRHSMRLFTVACPAGSNMAMTIMLRHMKCGNITVHGFRFTFRIGSAMRPPSPGS